MDVIALLLISLSVFVDSCGGTLQRCNFRNVANSLHGSKPKSKVTPCYNFDLQCRCSIMKGDLYIIMARILSYLDITNVNENKLHAEEKRRHDEETSTVDTKFTVSNMTTESYVNGATAIGGMMFTAMTEKVRKKLITNMTKAGTINPYSRRSSVNEKETESERQKDVRATDMKDACKRPYGIFFRASDSTKVKGSCYALLRSKYSWKKSRAECKSRKGDLVAFETEEELKHVKKTFYELKPPTGFPCFWTSGERKKRSEWVWASTNKQFSFNNWFPGHPGLPDFLGIKKYMYMGKKFKWLTTLEPTPCLGICENNI